MSIASGRVKDFVWASGNVNVQISFPISKLGDLSVKLLAIFCGMFIDAPRFTFYMYDVSYDICVLIVNRVISVICY